jgi:hypothetical protein
VAPLLLDAALEDPSSGGLVDRVRPREVVLVGREQARLEHAVDTDEPLSGLVERLRARQLRHEADEGLARRLRALSRGAQLGQPLAPEVRVLGAVPHVASEHKLGRELGRERDPAAHRPHHALLDEAVVPDALGGGVDREVPSERVRGHRR